MNLSEEELTELLKNPDVKVDAKHSQLPEWMQPPKESTSRLPLVTTTPSTISDGRAREGMAGGKRGTSPKQANTHKARRCYSELCQREFDSRAELRRGEELYWLEKAGEIADLKYQETIILSMKPKVTITLDFRYALLKNPGNAISMQLVYEDVKGWKLTPKTHKLVPRVERDFKVKLAWLEKDYGIEVKLVK